MSERLVELEESLEHSEVLVMTCSMVFEKDYRVIFEVRSDSGWEPA